MYSRLEDNTGKRASANQGEVHQVQDKKNLAISRERRCAVRSLTTQDVNKILMAGGVVHSPIQSGSVVVSFDNLNFILQSAFRLGLDYDLMHATIRQGEKNHEHAKR